MAIDSNVLQEVVDALKQDPEIKNNVYQATVSRIDGEGVVWVNIAGSDTETPTAITSAEVAPGDSVNVEWRNNKLYIGGNYSNPSAGVVRVANVEQIADVAVANASRAQTAAANAEAYAQDAKETADAVHDIAVQASEDAGIAKTAAESAQGSADSALVGLSTVQDVVGVLNWITAHGTMTSQSGGTFDPDQVYFVMDDSTPGDYHVGSHYYSIVSEPKAADINSYYVLTVDESVQNYVATHIVVDSEGLWIIPDAGGNKVLIATGSGSTYTTAGTYIVGKVGGTDAVLAEFTASGAVIGENASGKSRTIISADGMQVYRNVSGTDTQIANLGYGSGTASGGGTADAPYYTLGKRRTTSISDYDPTQTYQKGDLCKYNGDIYVCIINIPVAEAWNGSHWEYYIGNYSVSEGAFTTSSGHSSHAEGNMTIASGEQSHAEGYFSKATDAVCHAEGYNTTASGYTDHAEGYNTTANGGTSHAEGYSTIASGMSSHAQNSGTIAAKSDQTAIGRYNIEDTTVSDEKQKSFIIGNGTADNARSNALTVDWSGNVEAAGDVTDGSSNTLSSVATTLSSIAAHAVISTGSTGGWNYKKYADGTFEATRFSTSGATGAMTQVGSTGIYYSSAAEITFPSIGITGITSCLASVMPSSNYLMSYYMSRLTTAHVYFSYIRYGSGSAVTGISYGISITGTYS